jgi:hypothetical protein
MASAIRRQSESDKPESAYVKIWGDRISAPGTLVAGPTAIESSLYVENLNRPVKSGLSRSWRNAMALSSGSMSTPCDHTPLTVRAKRRGERNSAAQPSQPSHAIARRRPFAHERTPRIGWLCWRGRTGESGTRAESYFFEARAVSASRRSSFQRMKIALLASSIRAPFASMIDTFSLEVP